MASSTSASASAPVIVRASYTTLRDLLRIVPIEAIIEGEYQHQIKVSKSLIASTQALSISTSTSTSASTTPSEPSTSASAASESTSTSTSTSTSAPPPPSSGPLLRATSVFVCSSCRISYDDDTELRAHSKSDWHIYNVKRRGQDLSPCSEAEYVEDMEKQRQGEKQKKKQNKYAAAADKAKSDRDKDKDKDRDTTSDTSSESSEEEEVEEKEKEDQEEEEEEEEKGLKGSSRVTFVTPEQHLTVWKSVLISRLDPLYSSPLRDRASLYLEQFRSLATLTTWTVLMSSGGRFSGAVFQNGKAVVHRSFQRYTVRKKQGGAQSSADSAAGAGHAPKSMGAQIRRAQTVKFMEDCRACLLEWRTLIDASQRIYLYTPSSNRRIFMYDGSPLNDRKDNRIRTISFPVQRPTTAEVERVYKWLTTVECVDKPAHVIPPISSYPSTSASSSSTSASTSTSTSTSSTASTSDSSSKRKRAPRDPTIPVDIGPIDETGDSLLASVRAHDLEQIRTLLSSGYTRPSHTSLLSPLYIAVENKHEDTVTLLLEHSDQAEVVDATGDHKLCWTSLHRACADGSTSIALALLEAGADPTLKDHKNQPPYQMIRNDETRRAVRLWAGAHPDQWNYVSASIPPLTVEGEALAAAARAEKARAKKRAQREKAKEREKQEKEEKKQEQLKQEQAKAAEEEKKKEQAHREAVIQAHIQRTNKIDNMSEREKRAAAAEQRLSASRGTSKRCDECGVSISRIPYERLTFLYCSTACLQKHRATLDAINKTNNNNSSSTSSSSSSSSSTSTSANTKSSATNTKRPNK